MPYFQKIQGERIYLSPLDPANAELHARWINDFEVARWVRQYGRAFGLPAEQDWADHIAKDSSNYCFVIVLRDGERPIGTVDLRDLEPLNRTATLGILIGEADCRGKGYGAEAIRLLLEYGFQWLNLHNIDLTVNSENARAIACYTKVGFREYGRRHEALFFNGHYVDIVRMEILAQNWAK
ncbi:MAG: GNAT family N-acetyltransferase [Oscillospiraceae bacterium]|nr:GNAT family N-acetyltransferase [Oscillospiraceae bacterium]